MLAGDTFRRWRRRVVVAREGAVVVGHREKAPGKVVVVPLAFKLQLPKQQQGHRRRWGKPVQILYSRIKENSEKIALQYLDEPVVGFDTE